MKIKTAFSEAFRIWTGHPGASAKFLVVEVCMTLAAFTPMLFLTNESLQWLALLAVPFYLLLVLWARANAAAAMRDALQDGSLFSIRLAEPEGYGRKLAYGLKHCLMLAVWAAPLAACLVIAKMHISGDMDALTLMRIIKEFGGDDLMTGFLYLALILLGAILILLAGFAFHSGDRHAFVRDNPALIRGRRGKIMCCWLCALVTLLPFLAAAAVVIYRYLPALSNPSDILTKEAELPSTKVTVIVLAAGAVLTLPLLPLRSLISAAYVDGLEKE